MEMHLRVAPYRAEGPSGPRPESSRRRKDAKLNFGFNRLYQLVSRVYGPYTEYLDFLSAFQNNYSPLQTATALAMNEAIDRAYGAEAQYLKKNIYQNPDIWRLPVGFGVLSRLWR